MSDFATAFFAIVIIAAFLRVCYVLRYSCECGTRLMRKGGMHKDEFYCMKCGSTWRMKH